MQRLALLTTLMMARNRLPPTADESVGLASAVAALPSGLLAMVGVAITLLYSQLEVRPASEYCRVLRSMGARWGRVVGCCRSRTVACEASLSQPCGYGQNRTIVVTGRARGYTSVLMGIHVQGNAG